MLTREDTLSTPALLGERTAQYTAPLVLLPATIGITIAILLHLYLGCGVEAGELCLVGRTMEYGPAIPPVLSRLVSA